MATLHDDPLLRDVPEVEGYKVLWPVLLYAKIGAGGMGAVYRGQHVGLRIEVAVKCLKPGLAAEGAHFIARFQQEANLAARITHENLVRVYDVSELHGVHYIVMEFVNGENALRRVKRKGPLSETEAATILLGAARGLAQAHRHECRIVHRDVKPENIMISQVGEVKLADLGIAKALNREGVDLINTQGPIGTPRYMAPEQWDLSAVLGPQADVWALGATLYFFLVGDHAILGCELEEIVDHTCNRPFPDVRTARQGVSESLAAIVTRSTYNDPTMRYASATELVRALEGFIGGKRLDLADPGAGWQGTPISPPSARILKVVRAKIGREGRDPAIGPMPSRPKALQGSRNGRWLVGLIAVVALAWLLNLPEQEVGNPVTNPTASTSLQLSSANPTAGSILEPESRVTIKLAFSEDLVTARIAKHPARIVGQRNAEVDLDVPKGEGLWDIDYDVTDTAGGQAKGTLKYGRKTKPVPLSTPAWAQVVSWEPDSSEITDPDLYRRILDTGLPWRVRDAHSGVDMVLIPAGEYVRGALVNEEDALLIETPAHHVVISSPFYMGRFEVTIREWRHFVEETGHRTKAERAGQSYTLDPALSQNALWAMIEGVTWKSPLPRCPEYQLQEMDPVTSVSWQDAEAFCAHYGFSLPTEAQWEYSCRAGCQGPYWWDGGPENGKLKGNFADESLYSYLKRDAFYLVSRFDFDDTFIFMRNVSEGLPNGFGLFDILGNVYEWCASGYDEAHYSRCKAREPVDGNVDKLVQGKTRIVRGGGWYDGPGVCRVYRRVESSTSDVFIGFRVCKELSGAPALAPAWEAAADRIAKHPAFAKWPHRLLPQAGLVPLAQNSFGFEEFFVEGSGETVTRGSDGKLIEGETTGLVLVLLPPGEFVMGASDDEAKYMGATQEQLDGNKWTGDEFPRRVVRISHPFFLGRTEVTVAVWNKVVFEDRRSGAPRAPVGRIDLSQASNAGKLLGLELPNEAHWEYACRGGTKGWYFAGDRKGDLDKVGWHRSNSGTHTLVATKLPNQFGLFDMHGGVWEWCADPWHNDYRGAPVDGSTWNADGLNLGVIRGGAFNESAWLCRSASRYGWPPDMPRNNHGFRLFRKYDY